MTEPILIEALGSSENLRILNFFIENPYDFYSELDIANFSEITRHSVEKYLPDFVKKGYLLKIKGDRPFYRLNRENRIIILLNKLVDNIGEFYVDTQVKP